jgi:hypothetical protein
MNSSITRDPEPPGKNVPHAPAGPLLFYGPSQLIKRGGFMCVQGV